MNRSSQVIAFKAHHERAAFHLNHVEGHGVDEELTAGRSVGYSAAASTTQQLVNQGCHVANGDLTITIHVSSRTIECGSAQQHVD